jgi:hypothetical protein
MKPHAYFPSAMHQGDCNVCGNLQDHPMHMDDVAPEIERQLAWRGPTGKPQGHIVLTRAQAEQALMRLNET